MQPINVRHRCFRANAVLRPLLWLLTAAPLACLTQPAGVTSFQNNTENPAGSLTDPGAAESATGADASAASAGWVVAPLAPTPSGGNGIVSSPNVVSSTSPNAAEPNVTRPTAAATLPAEWDTLRYAFYDRARAQQGSATGYSLELYLSANPNFCTEDANGILVGGVLDEGERIYLVHLPASVRGAPSDAYVGPGDYGTQGVSMGVEARTKSELALSPNACQVEKAKSAYQGDVRVLSDAGNSVGFSVSGTLASASDAQGVTSQIRVSSSRIFMAKYCQVCSAAYQAGGTAPLPPYDVVNASILTLGPCRYQ